MPKEQSCRCFVIQTYLHSADYTSLHLFVGHRQHAKQGSMCTRGLILQTTPSHKPWDSGAGCPQPLETAPGSSLGVASNFAPGCCRPWAPPLGTTVESTQALTCTIRQCCGRRSLEVSHHHQPLFLCLYFNQCQRKGPPSRTNRQSRREVAHGNGKGTLPHGPVHSCTPADDVCMCLIVIDKGMHVPPRL